MKEGVVYIVKFREGVENQVKRPAQIVAVLEGDKVRIWARGPMEGSGRTMPEDEAEMYLLSAYHRAMDFLQGKATTFSGSWVFSREELIVLGTFEETKREIPPTIPMEMHHQLADWLKKPAIIWFYSIK